jgi:general secretion pathway protein H
MILSSHENRSSGVEAGFTLLEMLIVIFILTLILSITTPLLFKSNDKLKLNALADQLIGRLQLTRSAAIASNRALEFKVDLDTRRAYSPISPPIEIPSDVKIELSIAAPEKLTPTVGAFRYFIDGSSSGGDIRLMLNSSSMKISVNWLTGQARITQ